MGHPPAMSCKIIRTRCNTINCIGAHCVKCGCPLPFPPRLCQCWIYIKKWFRPQSKRQNKPTAGHYSTNTLHQNSPKIQWPWQMGRMGERQHLNGAAIEMDKKKKSVPIIMKMVVDHLKQTTILLVNPQKKRKAEHREIDIVPDDSVSSSDNFFERLLFDKPTHKSIQKGLFYVSYDFPHVKSGQWRSARATGLGTRLAQSVCLPRALRALRHNLHSQKASWLTFPL